MKIVIIDAQGGGIGRMLVDQLKHECPEQPLTAIGTNAAATAAMLKAGADMGATGENAVRVNAMNADLIIAPIGMLLADGMLGEVTAEMAAAIGRSHAEKILIPSARCGVTVAGIKSGTVAEAVAQAVRMAAERIKKPS
ncbi:MAG: DUF3842 family protein [Clostridia bacterium]|nr:DUF3842 family protein [Clostridia bacterium]